MCWTVHSPLRSAATASKLTLTCLFSIRRYLYVLDNALTTYTAGEGGDGKPPVPPCILKVGPSKTQVWPRPGAACGRVLLSRVAAQRPPVPLLP